VADVYDALPAKQRESAAVFTSNYGEAGAIALYGARYHLPAPLSGHNNYWLWGPGHQPDTTVIAFDSVSQLSRHFKHCRFDTTFHSPLNVNNDENRSQIWTCTEPTGPWSSFWPALKNYG
jgi:hypothetical protein